MSPATVKLINVRVTINGVQVVKTIEIKQSSTNEEIEKVLRSAANDNSGGTLELRNKRNHVVIISYASLDPCDTNDPTDSYDLIIASKCFSLYIYL